MERVEIAGKKILLRDWLPRDVEIFEKWQLGDHEWKSWDAPYYRTSDEEVGKSIEILTSKIAKNDFSNPRYRLVIADLQTNQFIGIVNSYWISQETNWLAAGIIIFEPKFWGGGIGREALTLWINYLFSARPELVRLDLQTWSGNERMMALASKLGFKLEGRYRNARRVNERLYDSIHFGILREEWESTGWQCPS
jgi:putative hydrolase of HD superfamily